MLGRDPIYVYPGVTAALLLLWIAAVYLVVRTFWLDSLSFAAVVTLVTLPSLFVFFRTNANFPNLVGIVLAGGVVVAVERLLRPEASKAWLIFLALSVHASLFAYPEMLPFVALPAALLLLRAGISRRAQVGAILLAAFAGLAVNPATTTRAIHGFLHAFDVARADVDWANPFLRIRWPQYPGALATLSLPAVKFLGPLLAGIVALLLAAAALAALQRARDRFAAAVTLSGFVVLLAYTLLTGFSYGWQKSVQFSAVFLAAMLPVAAIDAGVRPSGRSFLQRLVGGSLAGSAFAFFAMAMVFHALEADKWRERRHLSDDWRQLQMFAAKHLRGAPVLVEPAAFPMSFFHGMWSTYFLSDPCLAFSARGDRNGGYLHGTVATATDTAAEFQAVLVGREWAETFDANSPRLLVGDDFVLLRRANRVTTLEGLAPDDGVPKTSPGRAVIEIRPHSAGELRVTLAPAKPSTTDMGHWRVISQRGGAVVFQADQASDGPWNLVVPLTAGELHRVEIDAGHPAKKFPFKIESLRVVTRP
jgi:hypothetical protein